MKRLKYTMAGLLLILFFTTGYGQISNYFYYYKGEKIALTLDTKTIAISSEGENSPGILKTAFSNNFQAKLSPVTEDYTRKKLVAIDQKALERKALKTYYAEITTAEYKNQMDYEKQMEAYKKMPSTLMASPCFKTKEGKKMGLSNNFYVKLKAKNDVDLLYEHAEKLNIEVLGHNKFMPLWFTLACGKKTSLNALEAAILFHERGLFEAAEPEFILHDLLNSSDPYFVDQWGLKNNGQSGGAAGIDMKAEQAWTITTGSATIKTAVFDQGFEMNHPDLQANTYGTGFDVIWGTSPSRVYGPHGTECAGIIGATQNNFLGVSGIAPNSKLMSVSGDFGGSLPYSVLADGLNWAWQNGADIISNSWNVSGPSTLVDNAITNALTQGRGGKGTVIVFSSGNNNSSTSIYPANSNPLIINVGAIDRCGVRSGRIDIVPQSCDPWCPPPNCSPGSSYGSTLDVVAPGTKVSTTDLQGSNGSNTNGFGDYANLDYTKAFSGTSAACPFVAGVAALVLSANPNLTLQQVNDIIEQSAQKTRTDLYYYSTTGGRPNGTWNNQVGYGLVNAYQAVLLAGSGSCTQTLTITAAVVSPNTDNKQASTSITATNIINSGAKAFYHAGNKVVLNPGFKALSGSRFKGYIEGCTGVFQYKAPVAPAQEIISYEFRVNRDSGAISQHGKNTLHTSPNPFRDKLTISYNIAANNRKAAIEVYSVTGVKLATLFQTNKAPGGLQTIEWNAIGFSSGTYLIILTTNSGKEVKKVVKM